MRHITHKLLPLLLLVVVMVSGRLCAQTLYNNDTSYFCAWQNGGVGHYHIRDTDPFDSWGIVTGLDSTFTLRLFFYNICGNNETPMNGYIDIWDGNDSLLIHFTGARISTEMQNIAGEQVTFHIHYNGYSTDTTFHYQRNFSLTWQTDDRTHTTTNPCSTSPGPALTHLYINNITSTEADLHYSSDSIHLVVSVNDQYYFPQGGTLHLSGLTPNTRYIVKAIPYDLRQFNCCQRKLEFYTLPEAHIGCPDVLDLNSNYVRCLKNGAITFPNCGSSDAYCRHAIHIDTNERDGLTNNQLRTVGPGLPGSVRLGNWLTGGEYESVIYYLHVDTLLYSLIMLHYAAVLQNPEHTPFEQPRFIMQILDQNDSVIDPQCGAADFISDTSLGWNRCDMDVLWKDWTTIGINLTPYHGQDVRLKLTTYDCRLGNHFGYAYFYAECQQPYAASDHCGTVDTNTLTAPDGFNYLWYYDSPNDPVATTQSITYSTSEGSIHCRLSFIENPTCYLTLNTFVSNFWPKAIVDTVSTTNHGCDGYEVHFLNRSTILGDDSIPHPGNPPCESALWIFGDGYISNDYSPIHTYRQPGTYTVTLISRLAGGQCTDTTTYTIVAPDAWAPADQYLSCCDSTLWYDSVWYSHDTVGPTARIAFPNSCDTVYTLHLSILPSRGHYLPTDTFCYNSSYVWRGDSAPINHSSYDTLFPILTDTLVASNGCDSVVYLPLVQLPPDPLVIDIQPDCGLGYYLLTAVTDNPYWLWGSSPEDSALIGQETKRQIWVSPPSATSYSLTSYYGDSLFCPTTVYRTLSTPTFPDAKLKVTPQVITEDQKTLYAYDLSDEYTHRRWTIVNHSIGHDTLYLPDTLRNITYPVSISNDSVTVILAVSNDLCHDTAFLTLPIVRASIFAPNVFTPDADINNRFNIVCNGAIEGELTLYNRQGLLVFTTHDLKQGWDGTHNNTPCPQGAYVWHLRIRTLDRPDDWRESIGTVTLLR